MNVYNPLNLEPALQTEGTVLGIILEQGRDAMEEADALIQAEDFTNKGFADIYRAMKFDYDNGGDVSIQSVAHVYKGLFGTPIKYSRLVELLNIEGKIGCSLSTCAMVMKEARKEREIEGLAKAISVNKELPTDRLMEIITKKVNDILSIDAPTAQVSPASAYLDSVLDTLNRRIDAKSGITGIASGFVDIDALTAGWQPSTMVVVAARPAMGKTAFALSMARNICETGNGVAFFSLEMSADQLLFRLLSAVSNVDHQKLQTGRGLFEVEVEALSQAVGMIKNYPLYIDDTPLSLKTLRLKCKNLLRKHDIKVVIIDYLQLMTTESKRNGNRQEEVATLSRGIKLLAKELNIPIIVLAQLNRNVEARRGADKRPQLSDLRESGAIEQDADIVAFLHRPEYYGIEALEDGESSKNRGLFIIAKHRAGQCGDIVLQWQPQCVRFANDDQIVIPETDLPF